MTIEQRIEALTATITRLAQAIENMPRSITLTEAKPFTGACGRSGGTGAVGDGVRN